MNLNSSKAKKMLDKTLVGQRRSLKERHNILLQHSRVLKRRQGIVDFDFESEIQDIDLAPIKRGSIQNLENELEQQQSEKGNLESILVIQQEKWQKLNVEVIQTQFQIGFYEQQLQPLQDGLDTIKTTILDMEQFFNTDSTSDPFQATLSLKWRRIEHYRLEMIFRYSRENSDK